MGTKEALQAKMKKAAAQTKVKNTTNMNMQTWKVRNVIGGLYRTTKPTAAFKKEVINLTEILKEKMQFLGFGKPLIIDHDEQKALDMIPKLELQEIMFSALGIAFEHGVARIIVEPLGKDRVQLRLADPNFPNVVRKMGRIPYEAEVWTPFKFERAKYWKRTIYTEKYIKNDVYADKDGEGDFSNKKMTSLKEFNKKIESESLKIKGKMKNPYKFIPVVEIPYVPTHDLSTSGLKALAPARRLEKIQPMLNEGTASLRLERYLNRTKILLDQDLLDGVSREAMQKIADENIIAAVSDSGDADGKNKTVEVMQGDPKLTEYWLDITNTISLAVQALKLSELGESQSSTATNTIFNKGNDVETANVLGTFWQRKVSEVLEKSYAMIKKNSFTEAEIDVEKWGVQLVPNVIMNEAKMTDVVIAQLGAGLINMVQAKVKLESISPTAAKAQLEMEEEFLNPTLEATASFNDNGDDQDEPDKETGDPQPEGTNFKK